MPHHPVIALLAASLALLATFPLFSPQHGHAAQGYSLPDFVTMPWTGDFDGMVKRRYVRILVPSSKTMYFIDKGTQRGLVYDVFKIFEKELNAKLKATKNSVHVVFLPVARDDIIPALLEGRGDVAAANLTITPERLAQVDFSAPTVRDVTEVVVSGPGAPEIRTAEDLAGHEVYIRRSSSFAGSVDALNARLARAGKPLVRVRPAPEALEMEDILEMVNAGLVPLTIADSHTAAFWAQVFPRIVVHPEAILRTAGDIAWMIRKESPRLKAELDAFLARHPKGSSTRNQLLQKYLKSTKYVLDATSRKELDKFEQTVEIFRRYGGTYGMDYLLMMAQGYQESRLDHGARSPVGAIGVMQLMPATGREMKVGDVRLLENNIHAGVKYMRFMMDQYYADEPMDDLNKGLFTFASYNAGPGRIRQMRRIATERGLDPNRWVGNVAVVAAEKIGRETVQYVDNIYKYFLAYEMVEEVRREREAARESMQEGVGRSAAP